MKNDELVDWYFGVEVLKAHIKRNMDKARTAGTDLDEKWWHCLRTYLSERVAKGDIPVVKGEMLRATEKQLDAAIAESLDYYLNPDYRAIQNLKENIKLNMQEAWETGTEMNDLWWENGRLFLRETVLEVVDSGLVDGVIAPELAQSSISRCWKQIDAAFSEMRAFE